MNCNFSLSGQEDVRSAKGEDEVTLYNAKKRRIIYSSCRVGATRNLGVGLRQCVASQNVAFALLCLVSSSDLFVSRFPHNFSTQMFCAVAAAESIPSRVLPG